MALAESTLNERELERRSLKSHVKWGPGKPETCWSEPTQKNDHPRKKGASPGAKGVWGWGYQHLMGQKTSKGVVKGFHGGEGLCNILEGVRRGRGSHE